MEAIGFLVFLVFIYFLPSIIGRDAKYRSGIIILNVFLGWTILGWIGALIWAVSSPKEKE